MKACVCLCISRAFRFFCFRRLAVETAVKLLGGL